MQSVDPAGEQVGHALAAVERARPGSDAWIHAVDDLAEERLAAGDLDAAIATRRDALASIPDADRALDLRHRLGVDIMTRYRDRGDVADLHEACRLGEQALGRATGRLGAAANLAGRWASLAQLPGSERALDRALDLIRAELATAGADDPFRPLAVSVLAGAFLQRWHRDGDIDDLQTAQTEVSGHITGSWSGPGLVTVAGLMSAAAEQTSDLELLDRTAELVRQALAAPSTLTALERVHLHRLLATIGLDRYDWTGHRAALAEALAAATRAIDAAADLPGRDRALAWTIRATVGAQLARVDGSRAGLATAITDARAAHELDSADQDHAINMATLLTERYHLVGDGNDLDEAIRLLDRWLTTGPTRDLFGGVATDQATNLLSRFERDGDRADLDRGIDLVEAAIAATGPRSAELAARHDTAGRLRASRASLTDDLDDLARAQQHAVEAVECTPPESPDRRIYLNNWAMWVSQRYDLTGAEEDLAEAADLLEHALDASGDETGSEEVLTATMMFNLAVRRHDQFDLGFDRGQADWNLLQEAIDLFDDVLGAGHPHLNVPAGKHLGDIAWRLGKWSEAEHCFRLALAAAGQLAGLRPRRQDKESARSGVQGIGALAALSAARAGNVAAAAVHLEQASATLIAEAIGVSPDNATLEAIMAGARLMSRHILMLGCTADGGIGVLVAPDGTVGHVELPALTEETVDVQATAFRTALESEQDIVAAADAYLAVTAAVVGPPLTDLLAGVDRLAILPLGRLAWLPLTSVAAVIAREPVLLLRATPLGRGPAASGAARTVLVWADVGPPARTIPAAAREAQRVAAAHRGADVRVVDPAMSGQPDADADRLAELLAVDLLHLACHCDVDVRRPQDTVLQMRPPLRIGTNVVAGAPSGTHVVLSACDAARTGVHLPHEAFSAATAFLLAGAGSVTAPLWPIPDAAVPSFMAGYHEQLAAGVPAPRALATVRAARGGPALVHAAWVVTAWSEAVSYAADGVREVA